MPTRSIVHGGHNRVLNSERCWSNRNDCLKECERLIKLFVRRHLKNPPFKGGRKLAYGVKTKTISFKVPYYKEAEIKKMVYDFLADYRR